MTTNHVAAAATASGSESPGQIKGKFEARARRAKNAALFVASLHLFSRFLGFCALTWASVLLLGAFAPSLRTLDFFLVSSLLLLEGSRLFILHLFGKLLSNTLFVESHLPQDFAFQDLQCVKANFLHIVAQAISSIFASGGLFCTSTRFILTRSHAPLSGIEGEDNRNLYYALYIFYVLVIVNSSLAIASALLHPFLRRKCDDRPSGSMLIKQNCLMCFHDEVFKMAMDVGIAEADQIDILEFAYTKLSRDYKRNIRPPLIKAQNRDLICYLYHNQQGIAMTCEYLKSGDVWKQLVAANLPGFWAGEPRIELQAALFWALRERMYGAGKDAESALNSIECLGQAWSCLPNSKPYPFLIKDPTIATNVVDTLVRLLLEPIRPTLLFQLRAFEACCRNQQVLRHMYGGCSPQEAQELCHNLQAMISMGRQQEMEGGAAQLQELCHKLLKYVSEKEIWMTTKIYAGNALLSLLCYGAGSLEKKAVQSLQGLVEEFIDPATARAEDGKLPYFWRNDMILVETMRKKLQMGRYGRWEGVRIRYPDVVELPLSKALTLIEAI